MTNRKGEPTKTWLDKNFPHQVAIPAMRCTGTADGPQIQIFCHQVNVAPRHHSVRRDDKSYVVYCFANPQHAKAFAAIFEGEPFSPSLKGIKGKCLTYPSAREKLSTKSSWLLPGTLSLFPNRLMRLVRRVQKHPHYLLKHRVFCCV